MPCWQVRSRDQLSCKAGICLAPQTRALATMGLSQLLQSGRMLSTATRRLVPASTLWEASVCSRNLASLPEPISDTGPLNAKDGKVRNVAICQNFCAKFFRACC